MTRATLLMIGFVLVCPALSGAESAEETSGGKVGPTMAVVAANSEQGFKLSDQAAATIGLALTSVGTGGTVLLPKDAIVQSEEDTGVYRARQGWLKFVPGRAESADGRWRFTPFKVSDLRPGDSIATGGVPLVRVTDIYINSAAEGEGE